MYIAFMQFVAIFCTLVVMSQPQMTYQTSNRTFFVGQTSVFNINPPSSSGSTWKVVNLPANFTLRRQGHHEPFHMTTSWQDFRITNRNICAIYFEVTVANSTAILVQLRPYKYYINDIFIDDIGIISGSMISVRYLAIHQNFPAIWICQGFDLLPRSYSQTIDSVGGYNYTLDLTDVGGNDISIIDLNGTETQFIYFFEHIYLQSFNMNDDNFSLSASFTVIDSTRFTVHLSSKYTIMASQLEIKLLIYNKNEFLANGCKIFQYKVTFGALGSSNLQQTFLKAEGAPPTSNLLYGLQDFDIVRQMDIGFTVFMTVNVLTGEYTATLVPAIQGATIQSTTFYALLPTIIACPNAQPLVSDTFTECYATQCPSGQYDTGMPWGIGLRRPTVCGKCLFPCSECNMTSNFCTACETGYYLSYLTSLQVCSQCSTLDGNCLECKPDHCTKCVVGYVDFVDGALLCEKCSQFVAGCIDCMNGISGGIMCQACSPGYGLSQDKMKCINCNTISMCQLCSSHQTCTSCSFPYILGMSGQCDQCSAGYTKLDQFCVKTPGCQTSIYNPSAFKQTCLGCMAQYKFVYIEQNKTCACEYGYKMSQGVVEGRKCEAQCGDGVLVENDEECDDGNLFDGDGCSSTCIQQKDFTCTQTSPSQCILQAFSLTELYFNYIIRLEGTNRCKFSFTVYPYHPVLKYLNWQNYLTMNLSSGLVDYGTRSYGYSEVMGEVVLEVDYLENLEDLYVEVRIGFGGGNGWGRRLLQAGINGNLQLSQSENSSIASTQPSAKIFTSKQPSPPPKINSNTSLSIVFPINGANAAIIYQSPLILKTYQASSIISIILTILLLIQFFVGSYMHKMIGIETIQILQFIFFVRMIVEQKHTSLMNSFNVLKYTAYGGYENFAVIYNTGVDEVKTLTYMTVEKNFVYVGLMKFLSCNVNFSLIPCGIALIFFALKLIKKFKTRNQYILTRQQSVKDIYTVLRRSTQSFYDHFVFPFIIIFNMIIIFCTILYLQSMSSQTSSTKLKQSPASQLMEVTGFIPHLMVVFLTFFLYCFEVFLGYDEWQHSRLTEEEKRSVPKSMVERLEHDENNPDRANYKPGYSLIYLLYFLILEIVIMVTVMVKEVQSYGLEIIIGLNLLYLAFIWWWNPYCAVVNFHNKTLRLNHITVIVFLLVCQVFQRVSANPILYVFLMGILILLLITLTICSYVRIYVQYKFRKVLKDDNALLNINQEAINQIDKVLKDKMGNDMTKRKALLMRNPFLFENQIKKWMAENQFAHLVNEKVTQAEMKEIKMELMREVMIGQRERERQKRTRRAKDVPDVMDIIGQIGGMSRKNSQVSPKKDSNQSQSTTKNQRKQPQKLKGSNQRQKLQIQYNTGQQKPKLQLQRNNKVSMMQEQLKSKMKMKFFPAKQK